MMKFKQTEEISRQYTIISKDNQGKEVNLGIKVVWHDGFDEWLLESQNCQSYSQEELAEMLRLVTILNKETK